MTLTLNLNNHCDDFQRFSQQKPHYIRCLLASPINIINEPEESLLRLELRVLPPRELCVQHFDPQASTYRSQHSFPDRNHKPNETVLQDRIGNENQFGRLIISTIGSLHLETVWIPSRYGDMIPHQSRQVVVFLYRFLWFLHLLRQWQPWHITPPNGKA